MNNKRNKIFDFLYNLTNFIFLPMKKVNKKVSIHKKSLCFLLTLILCLELIPNTAATESKRKSYDLTNVSIDFILNSIWDTGFEGQIVIYNKTDSKLSNWNLGFDFQHEIKNIWDAAIISSGTQSYLISCPKYNTDISPKGKFTFGFTGSYKGNFEYPKKFTFNADGISNGESEEDKKEEDSSDSSQTNSDLKEMMKELKPVDYTILANGEGGLSLTSNTAVLDGFFYSKYDMLLKAKQQLDVQGLCASGGNIKIEANNPTVWGKQENADEVVFPDWLKEYNKEAKDYKEFSDSVTIENETVLLNENSRYADNLKIDSPSIELNSRSIAKNDVLINTSNIETQEEQTAVIISETGNIEINMSRMNYRGVLYAPNGTITLRGSELNFDGKIIAKSIIIDVDSIVIESYEPLDQLGLTYPISEKELEEIRKNFELKDENELEINEFEGSYDIQDKTRENKRAPYVISIGTSKTQISVSIRNLWKAKIKEAVIETSVYNHNDKKIFSKKATLKNIRKLRRKTKTYNLTQKSVVETIKVKITILDNDYAFPVGEKNVSVKRYDIEGGAHKKLKAKGGERHHSPADSVIKVYPYNIKKGDGAAFRMVKGDHKKTGSWGNYNSSNIYRKKQIKYLKQGEYQKAFQMDIEDIQKKFGNIYDDGLYDAFVYSHIKGYFSGTYKLKISLRGKK